MSDTPDTPTIPGAPPKPFVFPTAANHPNTPDEKPLPTVLDPSEEAIDAGIEESFPASDPVSVTVSKAVLPDKDEVGKKAEDQAPRPPMTTRMTRNP